MPKNGQAQGRTGFKMKMFTRHNSADSVPTSSLVCIKKVAIRTTVNHIVNIAEIIYYTCSLVIDIQRIHHKMPSANVFNELCVKIINCLENSVKN